MWLSASDTSDGRWPLQDAPQLAMARILRASCLLSLLLAGFVPPGRGQEKSKVSEPPGLKRSPLHPDVHRMTGRVTASPEAPGTPLVTLGLCALSTQTRVLQRAVRTQEDNLSRVHTFSFTVTLGSRCHIQILGIDCPIQRVWESVWVSPPQLRRVKLVATLLKNCWGREGEWADSLFTHPRGLETETCDRKNFDLETIPFWASVSPSAGRSWRGWLEGYGTLQLPSLFTAHWPATYEAATVALLRLFLV